MASVSRTDVLGEAVELALRLEDDVAPGGQRGDAVVGNVLRLDRKIDDVALGQPTVDMLRDAGIPATALRAHEVADADRFGADGLAARVLAGRMGAGERWRWSANLSWWDWRELSSFSFGRTFAA